MDAAPPRTDARYEIRDLLRVPSLLSLARVPLAAVFPFVVTRPVIALTVIALSGGSDLLDGWWARRFHQATPLGAVLDGATDKLFVFTVATAMLHVGLLAPVELLLLATRDIGEMLIGIAIVVRGDGRALHEEQRANRLGKLTTALQFGAVALALFGVPYRAIAVGLAAVVGCAAAASYARRAI